LLYPLNGWQHLLFGRHQRPADGVRKEAAVNINPNWFRRHSIVWTIHYYVRNILTNLSSLQASIIKHRDFFSTAYIGTCPRVCTWTASFFSLHRESGKQLSYICRRRSNLHQLPSFSWIVWREWMQTLGAFISGLFEMVYWLTQSNHKLC
jgi:hypothetical protein